MSNDLQSCAYRSLTNPIIFTNERWVKISNYLENILPVYWISDYGRVYSELINAQMKTTFVGKGYLKVKLKDINGNGVDYLIHRLVMMCFCYRSDCNELTVNHINGKHIYNSLDNLEWASFEEQMKHASEHNLLNNSVYSEEDAIKVCEMLERTTNHREIMYAVFGNPQSVQEETSLLHFINRVHTKQSWIKVSNNYDILPKTNANPHQILNEQQIRHICEILEQYGKDTLSAREIFKMIGIDIGKADTKIYDQYTASLTNIRRRKTFTNITNEYVF